MAGARPVEGPIAAPWQWTGADRAARRGA